MNEIAGYVCIMLLAATLIIQDRRIVALEDDMERLRTLYKEQLTKREEVTP